MHNTPASANAQAILHLVKGDALPDEVNLPASARSQNPDSDEFSLSQAGFVLFPNPAKKQVSIRYQLPPKASHAVLSLSTLHGQVVEQQTVNLQEGEIRWQLAELAPGIYVVQMQADQKILRVQKLIIQP
jgi:hypothetical protein